MNVPITLAGIVLGVVGFLVRRDDKARLRLIDLVRAARAVPIARGAIGQDMAIAGHVTECRENSLTVEDEAGDRALVETSTARVVVKEVDAARELRVGDAVTIYGAPRFESRDDNAGEDSATENATEKASDVASASAKRALFFAALDDKVPLVTNLLAPDLVVRLSRPVLGRWLLLAGALLVVIASFRK